MNRIDEVIRAMKTIGKAATVNQIFSACPSFDDAADLATTLRGMVESESVRRVVIDGGRTGYELVSTPHSLPPAGSIAAGMSSILTQGQPPIGSAIAGPVGRAVAASIGADLLRQAADEVDQESKTSRKASTKSTPMKESTTMKKKPGSTRSPRGFLNEPILDVLRNAEGALTSSEISEALKLDFTASNFYNAINKLVATGQIRQAKGSTASRRLYELGTGKPALKTDKPAKVEKTKPTKAKAEKPAQTAHKQARKAPVKRAKPGRKSRIPCGPAATLAQQPLAQVPVTATPAGFWLSSQGELRVEKGGREIDLSNEETAALQEFMLQLRGTKPYRGDPLLQP